MMQPSGADASAKPNQPAGLTATAIAGAKIRLTWSYESGGEGATCTVFNLYTDGGTGNVDYSSTTDTETKTGGTRSSYTWDSSALTDATAYKFAVRASTAAGIEDGNLIVVSATADSTAPAQGGALTLTMTR